MRTFEKALISGEHITDYIPQRAPIVMVDAFYGIDGDESFSSLDITSGTAFLSCGVLDECGVIEHVAQSAALRVGYIYRSRNEEVPLGFIGSVSKLTMHTLPHEGERLHTTLKIISEIMNVSLASASVRTASGRAICECQMKIFLQDANSQGME